MASCSASSRRTRSAPKRCAPGRIRPRPAPSRAAPPLTTAYASLARPADAARNNPTQLGLSAERQRRAGFREHAVEAAARRAQPGRDRAAGLVEINLSVAEIPGAHPGEVAVGAARGGGAIEIEGGRARELNPAAAGS